MSLKLGLSSAIILALALTGCASTGKEWVGHPVNDVIAKWGKEDKKVITLNGEYEIRRWHQVQQLSGNLNCYTYLFNNRKTSIVIEAMQRGSGCPRGARVNRDPILLKALDESFSSDLLLAPEF